MRARKDETYGRKRRKVGTIFDDELYRALKVQAAREGRPISDVVAEAVTLYLGRTTPVDRIVKETYGAFRVSDRAFRQIVDLDPWNP